MITNAARKKRAPLRPSWAAKWPCSPICKGRKSALRNSPRRRYCWNPTRHSRSNAIANAPPGDVERIGVSYLNLYKDVKPGDTLLLDDGLIALKVERIDGMTIHTTVLVGGALSDRKGINRLGGGLSLTALAEKDKSDIKLAAALGADFLAVSFAKSAADIEESRQLLRAAGGNAALIAKIERAEAIAALVEIIDASDAVMVARGDLGVEIGDAELPGIQKKIIRETLARNKVVITATQMMQSMVESPIPTRAEVLDVANAVLDGTDAVMLSQETAAGKHPDKAVAAMRRVCLGAERQFEPTWDLTAGATAVDRPDQAIARAAMYHGGTNRRARDHRVDGIRRHGAVVVALSFECADLRDVAPQECTPPHDVVSRRDAGRFRSARRRSRACRKSGHPAFV